MNLKELLEELRDNILDDVSDEVSPGTEDYQWSDKTLVRYINDGMARFAAETLLLRDETTAEICQIVLEPGVESYDLDPRVVHIFSARVGQQPLSRTTYLNLFPNRGDNLAAASMAWNVQPTQSHARRFWYTDRETQKISFYPAIDAATLVEDRVVQLRVARYPLKPLVPNNLLAVPELPERYHMDILEWAAWRCYRNHSPDKEDIPKGSTHKKRFEDAVSDLKRESRRLLAQEIQFPLNNNWSGGC